jgi:hypothetical protein
MVGRTLSAGTFSVLLLGLGIVEFEAFCVVRGAWFKFEGV